MRKDEMISQRHESTEAKLRWLEELREEAVHAGGEKAVARQRERGKLLARVRLDVLLDPGSFVELDRYRGEVPLGDDQTMIVMRVH